jgi:hypothetical protein
MRVLLLPLCATILAVTGCAPKVSPLRGSPAPARLPTAELPPGYRKVVFTWSYRDPDFALRGDGVARIAPPDSVRLDFFIGGGLGGGWATLIGDDVRTSGQSSVRKILPPPPLLWATLGRLRLPVLPDTTVRVDGDTLRADIGRDPRWRSTFVNERLRRLELIDGDRLEQRVLRDTSGNVRYDHPSRRRTLQLWVKRVEPVSDLDVAIWR